jgi:hypothetical protein
MKTKLFTMVLCSLMLLGLGCSSENEPNVSDDRETNLTETEYSLEGTKWKLEGIVNEQTGDLTELDSKDCDEYCTDCYTITFDTDSTFSGRITSNTIACADYEIDYNTYTFHITKIIGSEAVDTGDGHLYRQILGKIQSFTVKDTSPKILHLYYDGKNYLKYREVGG